MKYETHTDAHDQKEAMWLAKILPEHEKVHFKDQFWGRARRAVMESQREIFSDLCSREATTGQKYYLKR